MKVKKFTSTLLLSVICSMVQHEVKAETLNVNENNNYSDDLMGEYKSIQSAMDSDIIETNDSALSLAKIISNIPFKLQVGVHSLKEFTDVGMENSLIYVESGLNSVKISYGDSSAIVKIEGVDLERDDNAILNYTDLDSSRWSYGVVSEAISRKLIKSDEYTKFKPQSKITISDGISGLNSVLLKNYDFNFKNSRLVVQDLFSDSLNIKNESYRDVLDMTCRLDGMNAMYMLNEGDSVYTEPMSRILLARMLYLNFSDSGFDVNENKVKAFDDCYTEESIEFVTGTGLMVGDGSYNFNPSDAVTKEELASVLVRLDDMYNSDANSNERKLKELKSILSSLRDVKSEDLKDDNVLRDLSELLNRLEYLLQ